MKRSKGEQLFSQQVKDSGLPEPDEEQTFHPVRRWRFDFCWPAYRLAVEIEGGTWTGGRHTRGSGFAKDCEKYNTAVAMGWRVLRFPTGEVKNGRAIDVVTALLREEGAID